jgi:hypothetical protein
MLGRSSRLQSLALIGLGEGMLPESRRKKSRRQPHGRIYSGVLLDFPSNMLFINLFSHRLVTLRTCLLDTEKSLADVVSEIGKVIEKDTFNPLVSSDSSSSRYLVVGSSASLATFPF